MKKFTKNGDIGGHLTRNIIVAVLSFIVDYGVFIFLKSTISASKALIAGYAAGLLLNYLLSRYWAFQETRFRSQFVEFAMFTICASSGLLIDLVTFTIVSLLLPDWLSRMISIGVAFFWNFILKEYILFRKKRLLTFKSISVHYSNLTIRQRIYLYIRYRTAPLELFSSLIPQSAKRILEIGAGSGINLVVAGLNSPNRILSAYEPDKTKIKFLESIDREVSLVQSLKTEKRYDSIMIVDVLYLLPKEEREALVLNALSLLNKGGILVIKEMSNKPRYKVLWNDIQEYISIHITKMTYSKGSFQVWSVEDIAQFAKSKGYTAHTTRIDLHYLHPHAVVVIE